MKAKTALTANRSLKKNKQKGPKENFSNQNQKDTVYCSLGHPDHTDENGKTKKWRDFNKYQAMLRKKGTNDTHQDNRLNAAQLTTEGSSLPLDPDDIHPSYYDHAFTATASNIHKTIMDTGASSHMFGSKRVFKEI